MADEAHYALDADPASNPYQPQPAKQAMHKPGSRAETARVRALFRATEPSAELLERLAKGDVVVDYSSAKPSEAQFDAAGVKGVCRYESPLNQDGSDYGPTFVKVIQLPEMKSHVANGRYVRLNYEWYETRMDEGAPAGKQDAYWACKKAWALHQGAGIDPSKPENWWARWIIYSNDKDGTPYAVVKAYMLAAYAQGQSMPGKYLPDYYGRQAIYRMLLDDPDIHWMVPGWQTCAWSNGVYGGFADPAHAAAMYQALCVPVTPNIPGCDTNFVMQPDKFGGVTPPATVVVGEDAMIIVQAPTMGIGTLGPYGIYHLVPAEWNTISTIRAGLPAASRDAIMPIVKITDAQWKQLPPAADDFSAIIHGISLMYYGDSKEAAMKIPDSTGKVPVQGHPWNLYEIKEQVKDVWEKVSTGQITLTDDQVKTLAAAFALIKPPEYTGTLTPKAPATP